ncbi:MAG: porin [Planctomycetota bacterium]|nr:porin [Planctomycetota bacterium]
MLALTLMLWNIGLLIAAPLQLVSDTTDASSRVDLLEKTLQSVVEENARLSQEVEALKDQNSFQLSPLPFSTEANAASGVVQADALGLPPMGYLATYDKGIEIRPQNFDRSPYSLKINHQNTFRYTGFARDEPSWVDSAGNPVPIFDRTDFAIPRGRLILSGNALMPDLSYLLNIDYNTVNNNPIGFRAYALSYRFSRALQMHVGQNKVPGTREWLHSSFDAQLGPDRSMATTFFRPSLSQGVWVTGQLADAFNYHAMIANGFNTLNVNPRQLNNRFCSSQSAWWEPWGDFGKGYSDIEAHREAAVRLGGSYTFTLEEGSQSSDYPENTLVRLSNGTLITQQGALAPGVTLQAFHLSLAAIDVAFKYRGLSLSTEIYQQGLTSLQGSGPLPMSSLETYGGVAQAGYFVVPQKLELYTRNSFVTGAYGSGTEIATGFNWFPLKGKSNLRTTFDTAWLDSSPADQNRTGFVAGQSGLLIRTQITSSF